eukprot:609596-Rhodomonas_salina.1
MEQKGAAAAESVQYRAAPTPRGVGVNRARPKATAACGCAQTLRAASCWPRPLPSLSCAISRLPAIRACGASCAVEPQHVCR